MPANTPKENEYKEADAESSAGYTGPHRRSTDLPDKEVLHVKGSIRVYTLNALVTALSAVIAIVLFGTIQKKQALVEELLGDTGESVRLLRSLMRRQEVLTGLLLVVVMLTILIVVFLVLRPIGEYISCIRENKTLPMRGAYELRYLAKAYNGMYEENHRHNEELRYKVEHDALTGLYNRGAYEKLLEAHEQGNIALLWLDVDKFKGFNDAYGHDVGDQILQKVARLLTRGFRSSDYACRTGGDEFAVIMTDVRPEQRQAVLERIENVRVGLLDTSDGLPEVTLSIGVAFSAQRAEGDNLYKMADTALYMTKERGKNGCTFYGDE